MQGQVEFDRRLIERYDQRGPRYTSYPTAVQFRPCTESTYREWLRASNGDPVPRPLSLYLHIPFCTTVCYYCACNRIITANRARIVAYLRRLKEEVARQGALLDSDRRVEQIAWGGGTPNLLSIEEMTDLMAALDRHFHLRHDGGGDHAIELDPRRSRPEELAAIHALGFNRLSFGVQDLDPEVQAAVNREQPAEAIIALLEAARAAGFRSLNVDLIYGLPHQTAERFTRTLDQILEASPDRLSVFNYAHLPRQFKVQRQIREADLPPPAEKLAIMEAVVERMQAAGYVFIGMDHFARPTDELARAQRRHTLTRSFQGYTSHSGCDLIGLGMSAIGTISDLYAQNARTLSDYSARIDAGGLAVNRGIVLDQDDRIRRQAIQELMCYGELDTRVLAGQYEIDFDRYFAREKQRLETLAADGLVAWDGDVLRVLPRGRLLVRNVCMAFDRYLETSSLTRFSRSI